MVPFALSLVIKTVLLGGTGMLYGLLVKHLHDEQQLAPFGVGGMIEPRDDWAYLVFWAMAGVAWGTLLPWVDTLYIDGEDAARAHERAEGATGAAEEKAQTSAGVFGSDWTPAVRSIGVFVGIAFAIVRLSSVSVICLRRFRTNLPVEKASMDFHTTGVSHLGPGQPRGLVLD